MLYKFDLFMVSCENLQNCSLEVSHFAGGDSACHPWLLLLCNAGFAGLMGGTSGRDTVCPTGGGVGQSLSTCVPACNPPATLHHLLHPHLWDQQFRLHANPGASLWTCVCV